MHNTVWCIWSSDLLLESVLRNMVLSSSRKFQTTITHTNSRPTLFTPLLMLFASFWDSFLAEASVLQRCQYTTTFSSIWDSFLAQASVLLLCQYTATLSRGRGLIYFYIVDYSRISRNFSRNWLGLNNLCEIL